MATPKLSFVLLFQIAVVLTSPLPKHAGTYNYFFINYANILRNSYTVAEAPQKWSISFGYGRSVEESTLSFGYGRSIQLAEGNRVYWNPYNYPIKPHRRESSDGSGNLTPENQDIPRKWYITIDYGRDDQDEALLAPVAVAYLLQPVEPVDAPADAVEKDDANKEILIQLKYDDNV